VSARSAIVRSSAGVARRAGRLDQREQRVGVAVVADRLDRLGVARGGALVPQLLPRAAEEVHLAALPGQAQGLGVHVGQRQDFAAAPVLHDARHQAAFIEGDVDVDVVHHGDDSRLAPWRSARLRARE
jgi:hypothetical protein